MPPVSNSVRGIKDRLPGTIRRGPGLANRHFFRTCNGAGMVKTAVISLLVCMTSGCVATVYPQPKVIEPSLVYIADYGIHSGLLLPNGDGRYVEYAFGDWNYAALNHCWPQDGLGAMLVSYQATLGRRYVDLEPGETVPHPIHPAPHHLHSVYVSRTQMEQVVRELDERYHRNDDVVVYNPENLTSYVKDSEHYSVANNCNHLTARCLREMGCEVRGLIVISNFVVAPVQVQIEPDLPEIARVPASRRLESAKAN